MIGRFNMRRNFFSFCFAPAPVRKKMSAEELMDQLLAETVYHEQHDLRFWNECERLGIPFGFYQTRMTLKERLAQDERKRLEARSASPQNRCRDVATWTHVGTPIGHRVVSKDLCGVKKEDNDD